jgi:hypothetical protein
VPQGNRSQIANSPSISILIKVIDSGTLVELEANNYVRKGNKYPEMRKP